MSDDPGQGPVPEHLLPAKKKCDERRARPNVAAKKEAARKASWRFRSLFLGGKDPEER